MTDSKKGRDGGWKMSRRTLLGAAAIPVALRSTPGLALAGESAGLQGPLTTRLAEFVASTTYEAIPPQVRAYGKIVIADTIAAALGSYTIDAGKIVASVGQEIGGGNSTVLGSGAKVSPAAAAFSNAGLSNLIDADDTLLNSSHPAALSVFPALALAETKGLTGKALLTAFVTGYETAARILLSLVYSRIDANGNIENSKDRTFGWYTFGAAAASANALGLDAGQARNAIGMAAFASPLGMGLRWTIPRSARDMNKYSPNAHIAFSGLMSAQLAGQGFTADGAVLDDPRAYWRVAGALGSRLDEQIGTLGTTWWTMESALKPTAAGHYAQYAIELSRDLVKQHKIKPAEIESVEVRTISAVSEEWFGGKRRPVTVIDLAFSMAHAVAAALMGWEMGPEWVSQASVNNDDLNALAAKVKTVPFEEAMIAMKEQIAELGVFRDIPTEVVIRARGRTFSAKQRVTKGDPGRPFTEADVREKLDRFSRNVLPADKRKRLADTLLGLDDVLDVGKEISPLLGIADD